MQRISITASAKYTGQKESWTETCTGRGVLKEPILCLHKSWKPIGAFRAGVTTCVYGPSVTDRIIEKSISDLSGLEILHTYDAYEEYCYLMLIPAGTYVERFEFEYRFVMHSGVTIDYVGKKTGSVKVKNTTEWADAYPSYDVDVYESSVKAAYDAIEL